MDNIFSLQTVKEKPKARNLSDILRPLDSVTLIKVFNVLTEIGLTKTYIRATWNLEEFPGCSEVGEQELGVPLNSHLKLQRASSTRLLLVTHCLQNAALQNWKRKCSRMETEVNVYF